MSLSKKRVEWYLSDILDLGVTYLHAGHWEFALIDHSLNAIVSLLRAGAELGVFETYPTGTKWTKDYLRCREQYGTWDIKPFLEMWRRWYRDATQNKSSDIEAFELFRKEFRKELLSHLTPVMKKRFKDVV